MNSLLKKIPLPITGLMLAVFALGNLIQSYGEVYRNIAGVIGLIIFIAVLLKIAVCPSIIREELSNPVVFSVFPTFSMGMMLLATYLKPYNSSLGFTIWILGIVLHIILIIAFSMKHLFTFSIKKVFPSWFIVYVGIVVASVTAPAFNMISIGKIAFYFGLIAYILLMIIVINRVFIVKEIPEPATPTLIIFAAPGSLCLAGYLNSFDQINTVLFWALLIVSQIIYFAVLLKLIKLIRIKFYPSFSGFTFPLVISAIALKLSNGFLAKSGNPIPALKYLVAFEEILAVFIVVFVLIYYIRFIFSKIEN